jgi:hypothetical protein
MTISHNFLIGSGTKPTVAETTTHEIVINEADGTLFTKKIDGTIKQVGGQDAPDLSPYALTTYVDSENQLQDDVITGKEPLVPYGLTNQMAVVNVTADGFDFIDQPDFEFYRIRGSFIPYTGVTLNGFADTVGDNAVLELVADVPPAVGADPSGVTYRCEVDLGSVVIAVGDPAVNVTVGDLIFWSGDSSKWLHFIVDSGDLSDYYTKIEIDGQQLAQDTEIDGKAPTVHTHVEADITNLDKDTSAIVDSKDANTLISANSYTDTQIGLLPPPADLTPYETTFDSDASDAATLVSANGYTDTVATGVQLAGEPI